tara:strand:+ start:285 stop:785 length:501 start_codon:yes stop_codon:yes gene_type:complete
MEKLNTVYLSLGSDLGNREKNISKAIELIEKTAGSIIKQSSLYESVPLGFQSETLFYNLCLELETPLPPLKLLKSLQRIELDLGRIKDASIKTYESRIIDIDILYFNQVTFLNDLLTIPHPHINERKFVLIPLEEIAAQYTDPKNGQTIKNLLDKCTDKSELSRIE